MLFILKKCTALIPISSTGVVLCTRQTLQKLCLRVDTEGKERLLPIWSRWRGNGRLMLMRTLLSCLYLWVWPALYKDWQALVSPSSLQNKKPHKVTSRHSRTQALPDWTWTHCHCQRSYLSSRPKFILTGCRGVAVCFCFFCNQRGTLLRTQEKPASPNTGQKTHQT